MKPRDKAGDEIVRKTEASLPRWKGPSLEGWMRLEGQVRSSTLLHYSGYLILEVVRYCRLLATLTRFTTTSSTG